MHEQIWLAQANNKLLTKQPLWLSKENKPDINVINSVGFLEQDERKQTLDFTNPWTSNDFYSVLCVLFIVIIEFIIDPKCIIEYLIYSKFILKLCIIWSKLIFNVGIHFY